MTLEEAVARFSEVAPAEIRRWFPTPNNCIAAVRITTEVFKALGFEARALPVRFVCVNDEAKLAYVSMPHDDEWEKAMRNHSVLDERTGGWQGHLVAIVEGRWWIDPTWCAAAVSMGIASEWEVLEFEFDVEAEALAAEMVLTLDGGPTLSVKYMPLDDHDYESAPAWELDHLEPAIGLILRRMKGGGPQVFEQFVIYRRPSDFPGASIVVRRWRLVDGACVADTAPHEIYYGDDDASLAIVRRQMQRAGRIRWERFKEDDPVIVEVWF
jgi:hypothetical protein